MNLLKKNINNAICAIGNNKARSQKYQFLRKEDIFLIFLFLFLLMQGYFGIRLLIIHGILIGFFDRYLGNVGFGTRLNTKLFEKELFLRVDVPAYIFNDGISEINFHNWIFSFQRSI